MDLLNEHVFRHTGKSITAGCMLTGVSGDVVVENEEGLPPKTLLHSYCCLDYGRLLDVTQLRLFKLRKALKDKVQDRCTSSSPSRDDMLCCSSEKSRTCLQSCFLPRQHQTRSDDRTITTILHVKLIQPLCTKTLLFHSPAISYVPL